MEAQERCDVSDENDIAPQLSEKPQGTKVAKASKMDGQAETELR